MRRVLALVLYATMCASSLRFESCEWCQFTRQSRVNVSDSRGRLCLRTRMDHRSGCCSDVASVKRNSCDGCEAFPKCCSEYEACVSCCVQSTVQRFRACEVNCRVRGRHYVHAEWGERWTTEYRFCVAMYEFPYDRHADYPSRYHLDQMATADIHETHYEIQRLGFR